MENTKSREFWRRDVARWNFRKVGYVIINGETQCEACGEPTQHDPRSMRKHSY